MTYSSVPQMWVYPPVLLADFSGSTNVCASVPAAFPASAIIAAPVPGWFSEPSSPLAMQTGTSPSPPEHAAIQTAVSSPAVLGFFPQAGDGTDGSSPAPAPKKAARKRRARRRHARAVVEVKEAPSQPDGQRVPAGFCLSGDLEIVNGPPGLSPRQEAQEPETGRLDVRQLAGNQELCAEVIRRLTKLPGTAVDVERDALMKCLLPATRKLAFDKAGCRVVQEAIGIGNADVRDQLVGKLKGTVVDLYLSPCANYVLTHIVEVMPPAKLGFLQEELTGHVLDASRHQYGCRVLERLIEHWSGHELAWVVNEVLPEAEELCRHKYGNFVMQHLFEHGPRDCKAKIAERIIGFLPKLAKHRTASHVIQKALLFSDEETQYSLVQALLLGQHDDSLVEVACARYGIYVLEELASVQVCSADVRKSLLAGLQRLQESPFGQRAVSKFSLEAETRGPAAATSAIF